MNKRLRELVRLKEEIRISNQMLDEYDVYSSGGADFLNESDEISAAEEGFMQGYLSV